MKLMNYTQVGCLIASFAALMGCESVMHESKEIQAVLNQTIKEKEQKQQAEAVVPDEVMQELMAPQVAPFAQAPQVDSQLRFSIAAEQVNAGEFFASLVEGTSFSAAVHPEVMGQITLNLQEVTLNEALDVVQAMYGYDIRRQGRVLQVFPSKLTTQTFSIDYLMLQRMGRSRTTINSSSLTHGSQNNRNNSGSNNSTSNSSSNTENSSDSYVNNTGTVIRTESESDFWKELEHAIQLMIGTGAGKAVISSPQSGLLTVKAMPAELAQVEDFIGRLQNRVQRQVLLEAKILEVRLSEGYQQGINWSDLSNRSSGFTGGFTGKTSGNEVSNLISGVFSLGYQSSNFSSVIELLKTQGNVNVLSSPRISASNNQKAVIKVGSDEYFVTEVSTTTVTGTTTSTTPNVELTPFFEGIALDVTPQIDDLGGVLLHVHPSVTEIREQTKLISILDREMELPLAQSDIRETDTIVRANSGDVVVIGGLMSTTRNQVDSKVPVLGDLPLFGGLFTNISNVEEKTELVIMLKPTIIENSQNAKGLKQSRQIINQWYKNAQKRFD